MASCFRLPAGTYFLGDLSYLYDETNVNGVPLPSVLDQTNEDSCEVLDWMFGDITWNHHLPSHDMVGMVTGERLTVCVYTTDNSSTTKQMFTLPNASFFVAPSRIISRAWVSDVDERHNYGTFVTFSSEVQATVCVQDWTHSNGYLRLECAEKVVQMEYGLPRAPVIMPPSLLQLHCPQKEYEHISDDDLHALFVAMQSHGSDLHPRLHKHLRVMKRALDGKDVNESGLLHEVCRELAARSVKTAATARDHAFVELSKRKKRKL